jgi:RNA polymerase sigma factor (sigma-70 family)
MSSVDAFADLIDRVRGGDEAASSALFQRYARVFARLVKNRLDSATRALVDGDDVCQMVFCSLFHRLRGGQFELRSEKDLVNLLFRMASNKAIAAIRQEQARPEAQDEGAGGLEVVAGPGATPSRMVSARELHAEAQRRLTEEERQIQALRDEGLEWAEVAARLGGTADGRRKQWDRACARVKQELQPED